MKVHVLESLGRGRYRVVLHTAMPAGNNPAGFTWKSAYIAAGLAVTVLTEGTAPGNITAAEKAQVIAGDVVEIIGEMEAETAGTAPGAVTAAVTQMANAIIAGALAALQERLKFYGYTQN